VKRIFILMVFVFVLAAGSLSVFAVGNDCGCQYNSDCGPEQFCNTDEFPACNPVGDFNGQCEDYFSHECAPGSLCCDVDGNFMNDGAPCGSEFEYTCDTSPCLGIVSTEYGMICDGVGNCGRQDGLPIGEDTIDCDPGYGCFQGGCVEIVPEDNCDGVDNDCDGAVDETCFPNDNSIKYLYFNDPLARAWKTFPVGYFAADKVSTDCGEEWQGEPVICTQTEYGDVKGQYFGDSPGMFSYATVIDALGKYVTSKTDKFGQLISAKNMLGDEANYDYGHDSLSSENYAKSWDAKHDIAEEPNTENKYNTLGQLVSTDSVDSGLTTYTYNLDGTVDTITNAKGIILTNTYDKLGRVEKVTFSSGSYEEAVNYYYDSYDGIDELTGDPLGDSCMEDPGVTSYGMLCKIVGDTTIEYTYDVRGNTVKVNEIIDGIEYETIYDYDDAGNIISVITYDGIQNNFVYDNLNKLGEVSIVDEVGGVITTESIFYEYGDENSNGEKVGSLKSINYPSFVATNYQYHPRGWVSSIETEDLFEEEYWYDDVGNLEHIQEDGYDDVFYSYDDLYRLEGVSDLDTYYFGGVFNINYEYDEVGNRLVRDVNQNNDIIWDVFDYDYGDDNRLDSADGCEYTYDEVGNLVNEYCGGDDVRVYGYYLNGMLSNFATMDSSESLEFTYDPLGRRVKKEGEGGVKTIYVYGLGNAPLVTIQRDGAWRPPSDLSSDSDVGTGNTQEDESGGGTLPF